MSGGRTQKRSLSAFVQWWWEVESDCGEAIVRKNCEEQGVMELSLRLGDLGVIQASTCEERRNLVETDGWRVRFLGSGAT